MKPGLPFRILPCLALAATVRAGEVTVDCARPIGEVSPTLYGLMTEEINHAYDGGLYAELLRNRAFLDDPNGPAHWTLTTQGGAAATMSLDRTQPLDDAIRVSLRFQAMQLGSGQKAGFANPGYWGIPVRRDTAYQASFYAKAAGYAGHVTVSIESLDGRVCYATAQTGTLGAQWQRYQLVLQTGDVAPTAHARYVVRLDQPGTVWFSLVSLFPPTWNDRPNGLRPDLMRMLVALKPKFLRFPGGNYLEGQTVAERFRWKRTLGPLSQRPGHESPWGYRSTDGMGLLEFLEWCEDMGAEPVLAVYAGYSLDGEHVAPGKALEPYVESALDEIEYVTGDSATTRWGAERARDGHPAPFPLRYVEIGNEDAFDKSNSYDARFAQFHDAIQAKYPSLQCIATISPRDIYGKSVHSRRPDLVDDHYYSPVQDFVRMGRTQYDHYDRSGPKIFVGEWASYETPFPPWNARSAAEPPTANLEAALGDAAFMTDLERNSDVVVMHCYAPLFVNVNPGARQWRPDLIGYDALRVFGSPSYYAIRMFSTHVGDQLLKLDDTDSAVLASATRDGAKGTVYLKLVNPTPTPKPVTLNFPGAGPLEPTATALVLSAASATATNSIDAPSNVVPVARAISGVRSGFRYTVPGNGIVVLTLRRASVATIDIDVDHPIGRIDPHIYGVFMEPINAHRGGPAFNTLYGPVYDPGSPLADKAGFRTDIVEAARELELTQMRWPGGNFTAVYDWRDGIGPQADRPRRLNLAWGGVETNQMGTDQWVELNREIGSDNVVCINAGTGTIMEAADWVAYCNAPAGTYWADRRAADGHPRPYDIRYWCLGNEVDGSPWIIGHKTVGDYVKFAVEAAKAMRASSPDTKLHFVASGSSYYQDNLDWINWNWKVIQGLYGVADYLSIHRYWEASPDYDVFLGQRDVELEQKIDITAGLLKAIQDVRHGNPMHLSVDEWAPPFGGGALSTLALAEYFNAFLRHADVVKMANFTLLTTILGRDFGTGRTYKTPLFYAFRSFSTRCRGEALDPVVKCGTFDVGQDYRGIPYLDVSSTYNPRTREAVINVVNRDKDHAIATEIRCLTGRFAATAAVSRIASPDLDNRPYTYADRASYPPKTSQVPTTGSALSIAFPPHSFTQIVVPVIQP